jgi:hypothetical protein
MQSVSRFSGWALWVSVCERLDATGWVILHACSEHLEVEYCKSEKSFRFLRISWFWHFFLICNISLLSAPIRHTKFLNIFWPCAARVRGGGTSENEGVGGLAAVTICSQSPGKIYHISSFPIVRHLVQPPVATYGSCFLTCQVISSKKPYKGWISNKMQHRTKTKSFRIRYFLFFCTL